MKVNVIIPTFNRNRTLVRAIESVLNQSYKNFDLTIVDDGSTDDTYETVKPFLLNSNVRYVRSDNRGVSAARNLGVSMSEGEYVSFLDSDDEWLRDKLQKQIDLLKTRSDLEFVHAEEIWIRNGKRINHKKIHKKSGGYIFEKCLSHCVISPSTVLMTRRLFNEMNGFDEGFIVCEDFDLWLKITSLYEVGFIETPIINKYGGHEDQLSAKFFAMDYWRIKSLHFILGIRELSDEQRSAVIEMILKKSVVLLKGYKKHNNLDDYDEIESIYKGYKCE